MKEKRYVEGNKVSNNCVYNICENSLNGGYKMTPSEAFKRNLCLIPVKSDKRPLVPWKEYQSRRPTPDEIREWKTKKPAGWAVVTGAVSGCIVLDFDGEEGRETLGRLGLSPHVKTPSGGFHVYVQHPGFPVKTLNHESDRALGLAYPGLDIKGDGGYAIAFGCANGGSYEWIGPSDFLPFDALPAGLADVMRNGHQEEQPARQTQYRRADAADLEPFIQEALEAAHEVGRNNAAFAMFCKIRDAGFSREQAEAAVSDFTRRAPERNAKGTEGPITETEVTRTADSAYSKPPRKGKVTEWMLDEKGYLKSAYLRLLQELFLGDMRWCTDTKQWYVWDGKKWAEESAETVEQRVHRAIFEAVKADIELGADKSTLDWAHAHIKNLNSQEHWKRALELFKGVPGVATQVKDWNPDEYLINAQNGVVDLTTGKLLPHDKKYMMTKIAGAAYNPDTKHPRFSVFLEDITGRDERGAELREYIQKIMGLALVGKNYRQEIYIAHGSGRNGKSTLFNTVLEVLGDYAQSLPRDVLISRQFQQDASHLTLANCEGVRFGIIDELADRTHLSPTAIKDLASNNTMQVREIYQRYHSAKLQVTPFVITNTIPHIREETEGTWRRIKLIPFTQQIPLDKVDPNMEEKLLTERDGIFSWLVNGCVTALHERVPKVPDEVVVKTKEYRNAEDVIGSFIRDKCVVAPRCMVANKAIYNAYKEWCEENGEKHLNNVWFSRHLSSKGFVVRKAWVNGSTAQVWSGIGLKADYPDIDGGDDPDTPSSDPTPGGTCPEKKNSPKSDTDGNSSTQEFSALEVLEVKRHFQNFSEQNSFYIGESFPKSHFTSSTSRNTNTNNTADEGGGQPQQSESAIITHADQVNAELDAMLEEARQKGEIKSEAWLGDEDDEGESVPVKKDDKLYRFLEPILKGKSPTDPALDWIDTSAEALFEYFSKLKGQMPQMLSDECYGVTILNGQYFLGRLLEDLQSTAPEDRNAARFRSVPVLLLMERDKAIRFGNELRQKLEGKTGLPAERVEELKKRVSIHPAGCGANDWRARVFSTRALLQLRDELSAGKEEL